MNKLFILFYCFATTCCFGSIDIKPLAKANHLFSEALFNSINDPDKNIAISPFSISSSLYMSFIGADGLTSYEMQKALFLPIGASKLSDLYRKSYQALMQPHKIRDKRSFLMANALWIDQRLPVLPVFTFLIQKNFYGNVENIDFSNKANAIKTINHWVLDHTNKKIDDLITESDISSATKLMITNAAYFKSEWQLPFCKDLTYLEKFYLSIDQSSYAHIPMMHQLFTIPYFENESFKAICLPFDDTIIPSSVHFICILPKSNSYSFSHTDLVSILEEKKNQPVDITLPIFKIKTKVELKKTLIEMGMIKPFTTQANFSGITGKNNLCLTNVIHSCDFSMNEEGVEATAAVAVPMNLKSIGKPTNKKFQATHPFIFLIYDMDQNYILFIGAYKIPKSS